VAGGKQGLVILDIERPDQPRIDQVYNAEGEINDTYDVKLGITYVSEFAYLADGKNGLQVVQLTSPDTPGNTGYSPRPTPKLIAHHKLPKGAKAYAISKAVDRDRAVDEAGNQIGVFGRIGARPLNLAEQRKMYLRNGKVWMVDDNPWSGLYRFVRYPKPQRQLENCPPGRPADLPGCPPHSPNVVPPPRGAPANGTPNVQPDCLPGSKPGAAGEKRNPLPAAPGGK
jgi:hypothetical protein